MKRARAQHRKPVARFQTRENMSRFTPLPCALADSFRVVARVARAGVFRRPRRAYTLRARRLRRRSLATPPYGRLHTPALPPIGATREFARRYSMASNRAHLSRQALGSRRPG